MGGKLSYNLAEIQKKKKYSSTVPAFIQDYSSLKTIQTTNYKHKNA